MKRIYLSLSDSSSFDRAIKELKAYQNEIHQKTEKFLDRLMESGIQTAIKNTGKYKGMITFSKIVQNPSESEFNGILIATDGRKLVRTWYTDKALTKERSYEVSPLLLAEFGSGWLANVLDNVPGVGQGTMPNSYGHATDPEGWYWYDESGVKHHSIGEAPTYPMHTALISMSEDINRIGREVFNG